MLWVCIVGAECVLCVCVVGAECVLCVCVVGAECVLWVQSVRVPLFPCEIRVVPSGSDLTPHRASEQRPGPRAGPSGAPERGPSTGRGGTVVEKHQIERAS